VTTCYKHGMGSHRVLRRIGFCYGHRIRGHGGPCAHLHGHNAMVEIVCEGPLDALGMVVDFGEIRDRIGRWIDDHWDHRMVLARSDPIVPTLRDAGEPLFLLDAPPTAENMAAHLYGIARGAGLPVLAVRFWETETSMASFGEA